MAVTALLGILSGSVPRPAAAQANYRLAPVGGRTTLVGGTGLAFGRDSASAFLNPATVVRVDAGRLAFSVNFYELSFFSAPRWYAPGEVDRARFGDVPRNSANVSKIGFDSLPSSLCIFLRAGYIPFLAREQSKELAASRARLGLCLATVQASDFSFDSQDFSSGTPTGGTRQAQTVIQSFRRIAVGPSYAMHISNALSMGASLHVSRASFRSLFENTSTTYGGSSPVTSIFYSSSAGHSYDVSATVGATYRIGAHQTVAAVFESPSLHVFGSGGISSYTHYDAATNGTSAVAAEGSFAANRPMRIGLGTGIERPWGLAEVNVAFNVPVGPAYDAQLDGHSVQAGAAGAADNPIRLDLSTRARGVVNIGVGTEVNLSPSLSVLGGVSTDFSTVPKGALLSDPMSYFPSRTQKLAASFGVGSHGVGGDLYFGGELGYAWGERLAVNAYQLPPRLETTPYESFSLLVIIAGTTSFKAIARAVTDLSDAVDPTKK